MAHPAPKFTPGPWKQYVSDGDLTLIIVEADGSSLGEMTPGHPDMTFEQAMANAALVAAAPDLYDWIATIENDDGRIPDFLWQQRESLLAKARGEQ